MRKTIAAAVLAFLVATIGAALADSIRSFASGEAISANGLNSNFAHIHNTMVGGHGARLVNADVSASAAIAHTKLATPALVPKAWAITQDACSASPCTVAASAGFISGINFSSTGVYYVLFSSARPNLYYSAVVSPVAVSNPAICNTDPFVDAGTVVVKCYTATTGAASTVALTNSQFSIVVLDNDN